MMTRVKLLVKILVDMHQTVQPILPRINYYERHENTERRHSIHVNVIDDPARNQRHLLFPGPHSMVLEPSVGIFLIMEEDKTNNRLDDMLKKNVQQDIQKSGFILLDLLLSRMYSVLLAELIVINHQEKSGHRPIYHDRTNKPKNRVIYSFDKASLDSLMDLWRRYQVDSRPVGGVRVKHYFF